jgi:hypothetical protein
LKNGTSIPAWGQHGAPPTCVSPYGQACYLARQAELKSPTEQHCLKHIGRLYREDVWSRYKRDLVQREHFSVWTDRGAKKADGRKSKKQDKDGPLDVVERLDGWLGLKEARPREDRKAPDSAWATIG